MNNYRLHSLFVSVCLKQKRIFSFSLAGCFIKSFCDNCALRYLRPQIFSAQNFNKFCLEKFLPVYKKGESGPAVFRNHFRR